ncbi:MAG: TcfC E-set like domain-containing protein [Plesiomonas shigelloides]
MRGFSFFTLSFWFYGVVHSSAMAADIHDGVYNIAFNNMRALNDATEKKLNSILSHSDKKIQFAVVGTEDEYPPVEVNAKVSYYSVIIDDKKIVSDYLFKVGVSKKYIQDILDAISTGAIHDNECEGERSSCIVINDKLRFVNDYYGGVLRVFLPSEYVSQNKSESVFINPNSGSNQLVSNIYANYDGNTSAQDGFFLTANNYLGLGVGYVNLNGMLSSSSSKLNSFEYIADFDKYTLSLGFSGQDSGFYPARQNSLFLDSDFVGLTLGKTNNLLVNDVGSKSLSFFSPSSGAVEIFRNNKIVYQGYIGSGYQSIPYSSFPLGNYDVDIVVKNNGNVVFNGRNFVSNVNSAANNEFMPYFRAGVLKLNNWQGGYEELGLFEIGASYPLFSGLSAVANGYFVDEKVFYTAGFDYHGDQLRSNIKYTKGDNFSQSRLNIGYRYLSFQLTENSYDGKSVKDVEKLDNFSGDYNYSNVDPYSRLQASLSANIPVTNNYSIYGNAFYSKDRNDELSAYSYSIGGTYRSNKNLSVSVDYTIQDSDNKIGLNFVIPLWDDLSYSSSLSLSRDKQINNYLNYNKSITDTVSAAVMVGYNYNQGRSGGSAGDASVSGSLHQYNDYYSGSVRAGWNTYNTNYGFTLNTTQLVNREGVFYTSQGNVKSSLLIKNKGLTGGAIGDVQLFDKGQQSYRQHEIGNETMIYFDGYKQQRIKYQFNEDGQFVLDQSFKDKNIMDFSPGRVNVIDVDVVDASQLLVITPKLSVNDLRCDGTGCLSVQEIQQGVFKVLLKPKVDASVYVGNSLCWSGMLEKDKNAVELCEIKP